MRSRETTRGLLLTAWIALMLCAACGLWLHVQQRQYSHSRQLIAAVTHNDARTALALVQQGADPNTRQSLPPAPSLKLLLNQLLHGSPPANDSPTTLMFACGLTWCVHLHRTQSKRRK